LFVGIAQFAIIGLTVAESVYPGYSVSQNYISDLGVGPAALIFDPSIILVGLVVLATAWFLLRAFKDRLVSIVVALGGAGAIAIRFGNCGCSLTEEHVDAPRSRGD